jgi:hypothetical protein
VLIHVLQQGKNNENEYFYRKEDVFIFTRTFVFNRFTDKLTPLTDRIFCLRSGSAADTQTIAQVVTYQLDFLS